MAKIPVRLLDGGGPDVMPTPTPTVTPTPTTNIYGGFDRKADREGLVPTAAVTPAPNPIITPEPTNPWDNPPSEAPAGMVWRWVGAKTVGRPGSGSWQLLRTAGYTAAQYKGSGTTGDPLLYQGSPFSGYYNGATYNNGVRQAVTTGNTGNTVNTGNTGSSTLTQQDIETKARRTAQQDFRAVLGEMGLADLADEVDRMIKEDFTVAQMKLELPKSASYKMRFPGMEALRTAGNAINEATYISNERGYLQTLRAYGLDTTTFGSRAMLGKYIANMVAPREFEERVDLAATKVRDNPDVVAAFKTYYPEVDDSAITAYLLNPEIGKDIIKKQVRTAEIGAAAIKAGFDKSVNAQFAGSLIGAVGETSYTQIANEFQRARQLANNQRRLSQIENQTYSDLEAVSTVVGDDVTAALASERRVAREAARFSARGGVTGASLTTQAQV